MSLDAHTKPRINASLMSNYVGKTVCLLGMAKNVDSSGNHFTLTTSDNKDVRVMMQEPIQQRVSGLTEVCGLVKGPTTIMCEDYLVLPDEISQSFDIALYQKALAYIQRCPDHYTQGGNIEA